MANPLFLILYAITRNTSFETTIFYKLCLSVLGSVAAIATGFFAWWVNHGAVLTTHVKYRISLSVVLCMVLSIRVIWRFLDPVIIVQWGDFWPIYAILILASCLWYLRWDILGERRSFQDRFLIV
jgi:hypothetical protein